MGGGEENDRAKAGWLEEIDLGKGCGKLGKVYEFG